MKTTNTTLELELNKELAEALIADAKDMKNKGDRNIFKLIKGLSILTVSTCLLYASISFISSIAKDTSAVNNTMTKSATHLSSVITKNTFNDNFLETKISNKNNLTCFNTFVYNKSSNVKCFITYNS